MSKFPSERENAAPNTPVILEKGQEPALGVDQNSTRRRIANRRNPSSSLLSRLFSTTSESEDSQSPDVRLHGEPGFVATGDSIIAPDGGRNDTLDIHHSPSAGTMAMTIPPIKPPALSLGATPTSVSTILDVADMRHVNSLLMSHRDFLNSNRGRGTSLERTQKERRIQESPKSIFSTNPGDTGMVRSSGSRSPTTPITSSDNPSLDGFRATYRSWRDAHPGMAAEKAWSIGEQASGEVPEGQVEKSIAEALAGIEPNSRSRKASHSLRFFKEGLPEDKPKKREVKDNIWSKDKSPRMKEYTPAITGVSGGHDDSTAKDSSTNGGLNYVDSHEGISTGNSADASTSLVNGTSLPRLDNNDQWQHNDSQIKGPTPHSIKRPNALPAQLLDDLRKRHNLTPAATKGLSFSGSLPVTESERRTSSEKLKTITDIKKLKDANDEDSAQSTTRNEEDEESGEEQISSALFVPHQGSRDQPDCEAPESEHFDEPRLTSQRGILADPEQWLIKHEVPSRESNKSVAEKQSPDEQVTRTGDYLLEEEPEGYNSWASNTTEQPTDALSDGEYASLTDDPETTPTNRSKARHYMSKNHQDHLHRHQQVAKAPLEAIELIPYRHQVGGHTTMWRFSKRAVCKQLNNRENEFYERIERYHPKLLKFMPRYVYFTWPCHAQ
jgi:inositol-hexakisphosphate kinase